MNTLYALVTAAMAAAPATEPAAPITKPQPAEALLDYVSGKPCLNSKQVRFVANARVAYFTSPELWPGLRQDDVDDAFTKVLTRRGYALRDSLAQGLTVKVEFRSVDKGDYLNLGFQMVIKDSDNIRVYTDRVDQRLEKKSSSLDFYFLEDVAQRLIIPTCAYLRQHPLVQTEPKTPAEK